jgi:1,4-alpha-glucan branching enzyme
MRRATDPNDFVFVACNFTPVVRNNYRLGVPEGGCYDEIFNTDSKFYGGSNVGNYPSVEAEARESHGRPFSIELTLPPLGVVIFKPRRES